MNKKVNVEIQEFEPKTSNGGKKYARFKTNMGWMSAFDKPIILALKDMIGERANLLIAVDDEKGFKNIRKILKSSQSNFDEEDSDNESDSEESDEDEEMDQESNAKHKAEVVKVGPAKNPQATMWASYAKDILVEMIKTNKSEKPLTLKDMMTESIELIKQARTAFE
jgi:hypothetical protein